jgi:hypothetical protein
MNRNRCNWWTSRPITQPSHFIRYFLTHKVNTASLNKLIIYIAVISDRAAVFFGVHGVKCAAKVMCWHHNGVEALRLRHQISTVLPHLGFSLGHRLNIPYLRAYTEIWILLQDAVSLLDIKASNGDMWERSFMAMCSLIKSRHIHSFSFVSGSTALFFSFVIFFFFSYTDGRTPWRVISPSQGRSVHKLWLADAAK